MSDDSTQNLGPTRTGLEEPAEALPERFGRYKVQRHLASGGMGAVYLAIDEVLQREVAVKCIKPFSGALGKEFGARFMTEARCIAALKHPNVVSIYDLGMEATTPYLVMEVLDGPALSELIGNSTTSVRDARIVGIQIANALAEAHAADIVHRDVKPANILQTGKGTWKIVDFGVAHVPDSGLTGAGDFLGTPAYAALESLKESVFTPASDIYGLGATLFHALTGSPPFGLGNSVKIALAAETKAPPPVSELRSDVPEDLAQLIDRSLSHDPSQRPSASDFAQILAQGTTETREAVPTPTPAPTPVPTPTPAPTPALDSRDNSISMATTIAAKETGPQSEAKPNRGGLLLGGLLLVGAVAGGIGLSMSGRSGDKVRDAKSEPKAAASAGLVEPAAPLDAAPTAVDAALADEEPMPTADEVAGFAGVQSLVKGKQFTAAIQALEHMRKKYPDNAYLPYYQGQLQMSRTFWREGFEAYEAAIELDSRYRHDEALIDDAIRGLASKSKPWMAEKFIRYRLGSAALERLELVLEQKKNPAVNKRIKTLLRNIRNDQ